MNVAITSVPASGFRSVEFDSASNAHLIKVTPSPIAGANAVSVSVAPVDAGRDASGVVVLVTHAGTILRLPYVYRASVVSFRKPSSGDLDTIRAGESRSRNAVVVNSGNRRSVVRTVRLAHGDAFTIDTAGLPRELAAGDTTTIAIQSRASLSRGVFIDTLYVELECSSIALPLRLAVVAPCISPGDVAFGTVARQSTVVKSMQICNSSLDAVTLSTDPDSILTWDDRRFSVNTDQLQLIAGRTIQPGECLSVDVQFTGIDTGTFRTVARARSLSSGCRDSAVWSATVSTRTGVELDRESSRMLRVEPNPADADIVIELDQRHHTVYLIDARGRVVLTQPTAGQSRVTLSVRTLPAGLYTVVAGEMRVAIVIVR